MRASSISSLTFSEKRRLAVACQLLSHAAILILDQFTDDMDIFDTFFLVEYLQQYSRMGKVVIMTLQPPTFEIFAMCTRVLLLSGGKTIFSGLRQDLPKHMGIMGFPCPPFKNPADYYLDLVTLDDLSAAAMLESKQRIETLIHAWEMSSVELARIPPTALPHIITNNDFFGHTSAILKRNIIYFQPIALLNWIRQMILFVILSLAIGFVFWDLPSSDSQLAYNDRLGYHHTIMAVGIWPIVMFTIRHSSMDSKYAADEIRMGLYPRSSFIIIRTLLSIISSIGISISYVLPSSIMTSLYMSDLSIYIYTGYMVLFLNALHMMTLFTSNLFSKRISATVFLGVIISFLSIFGGFTLKPQNVSKYMKWIYWVTPEKWLLPVLVDVENDEANLATLMNSQLCRSKQVQHHDIIVQQTCVQPNVTQFLSDFLIMRENHVLSSANMELSTILAFGIFIFTFFILTYLLFICKRRSLKK